MKLSRILAVLLVLCMLTASALALTPEEAEKSVVRIYVEYTVQDNYKTRSYESNSQYVYAAPEDDLSGAWIGTGWAIGTPGQPVQYFVTNHHVADDSVSINYVLVDKNSGEPIKGSNGKSITKAFDTPIDPQYYLIYTNIKEHYDQATRVAVSDRADLAVLKLSTPTTRREAAILRPYTELPKQTVFVLGYPGAADALNLKGNILDSTEVYSTEARITSFRSHEQSGEGDMFMTDAATGGGNSGGPVVDASGCVLGVHSAGSTQIENMKLAVSINEVVTMLDKHGIPYTTADQAGIPAPDPNGGGGSVTNVTNTTVVNNIPVEYIVGAAAAIIVVLVACVALLTKGRHKKELAALKAAEEAARKAAEDAARKAVIAAELAAQKADNAARKAAEEAARNAALQAQAAARKHVQMESTIAQKHKKPGFKEIKSRSLYGEVGALAGRSFPLNGTMTIGRDSTSDIVLPMDAAGISRRHCTIQVNDGVVTVTDNGSSYGTWIGNVKLPPNQPIIMHRGHKLYLGSKQQVFVLRS